MFRSKRGINLTHDKQGLIYFICLDYKEQPYKVQTKILNLCLEIAAEDYQALFDVLTTHKSIIEISLEYFIAEKKIYNLRKQFYEKW